MSSMSTLEPTTRLDKKLYILGFPLSLVAVHGGMQWAGGVEKLSSFSPLFCPLHRFLGLHCPTCGLTRSLLAAWNFDFSLALQYHFLGPVLFLLTSFIWLLFCIRKDFLMRQWISKIRSHPRYSLWAKMTVLTYIIWGFAFHDIG